MGFPSHRYAPAFTTGTQGDYYTRDLLDELEVWGNKLLELEAGELHAVPQDDIVMHFEEGFPVTFRRVGDKLMVNATQITMHFGKSRLNGYASLPRICSAGKWPATDIPGNTSRKSSPHGAGARCDLVGITACHTVGQMDRP